MCEGDCTKRSRAPFCLFEELISSGERFGFAGCVGLAMKGCRRSRSSSVGETLGKAGVVLCALKPRLVQEAWRYPRRELLDVSERALWAMCHVMRSGKVGRVSALG